jgi:DNA-binding transcriptional LysR family regulator
MYKSNINLNLYKTFYDVATSKSISEASKKTFISQPAISKSIKKLEEELQTQLFYRNLDGIKLTEKGKELLFYVNSAYNNLITAERSMIETENLEKGKLSIGVPSQIGTFYIFDNIEKFHEMHPNIEITIISKSTHQLLSLLESHEIDFIIDSSPVDTNSNKIIVKPLTKVQNCFIACSNSKFLKNKNINKIKDLENTPLILPIKGTANRITLDETFENNKIKINNVINIHTSEMIIGAVKKDLGIGYVIYDLVKKDIEEGNLQLINIEDELPAITINLVYIKKYLTAAPLKFIKTFLDEDIKS